MEYLLIGGDKDQEYITLNQDLEYLVFAKKRKFKDYHDIYYDYHSSVETLYQREVYIRTGFKYNNGDTIIEMFFYIEENCNKEYAKKIAMNEIKGLINGRNSG